MTPIVNLANQCHTCHSGYCVQLGISGSFKSPVSGDLWLFYNDWPCFDNFGQISGDINGIPFTFSSRPDPPIPVPGPFSNCTGPTGWSEWSKFFFGAVTAETTYSYNATGDQTVGSFSGLIRFGGDGSSTDLDGFVYGPECVRRGVSSGPCGKFCPDGRAPAPYLTALSLVGVIV